MLKWVPRIWWHWQNLNEDSRGEVKGTILRHGRAWLHVGKAEVHWEWSFGKLGLGADFRFFGDEEDFGWSLRLPGFSFYWDAAFIPWSWKRKLKIKTCTHGYETGFYVSDWTLRIKVWREWCAGWNSKDRWWQRREWSFNPVDFAFGHLQYSGQPVETSEDEAAFPERTYKLKVEIVKATWRRKRWPWWPLKKTLYRATITSDRPVPEPGKGENSWDCGEDATYGLTCTASTRVEAVTQFIESVLRTRARYGGRMWRPEEKAPIG